MKYPVTQALSNVFMEAQKEAIKYSNTEIGTEHVLYGISVTNCPASKMLRETGITKEDIDNIIKNSISPSTQVVIAQIFSAMSGQQVSSQIIGSGQLDFTDRVKIMLNKAHQLCQSQGGKNISPEHLFYCILDDKQGIAYQIIAASGVDTSKLLKQLLAIMRQQESGVSEDKNIPVLPQQLKDLGFDVTQKAREHKIDPIIGRKDEIERIIQILCRKTKNNPVLIGEPGVGKSAVVEGLANAIADGKVPEILRDKIVFSLDLGSLMAGTKYRGALEEKLKNAIELIKEQNNIIVFIDEIHTLAQSGSEKGEVSPADMLKPYLARGELQTIGATTLDEYRKYIETDKALERRFQPIIVEPPKIDDAIEILRGLKENYETFHRVNLTDEAIVAAVKLSDRYIADRFLPDKAIDLIDEAMAKAKVAGNITPPKLKEKEELIKELEIKKQTAVEDQKYEVATKIRDDIKSLRDEIADIKLKWGKENEKLSTSITAEDIATIVAKWTKIPVTKLNEGDKARLVGLEDTLKKRVIGQDKACSSIAKAIRRARVGLKDPNRPIGSFLFIGPTGVGKTELTKALAEAVFDDENNIIRLDMSEYMEAHSVSKLIGSPPGYVGHDEGGQLTEQVRRKPYSVVLFDEIEKAHGDVYNSLLQILDDGRLTDSQGRVVSFKNTVIIMTSNVGVDELKNSTKSLGFHEIKEAQQTEEILTNALKKKFKPEFLNRIDVVVSFEHLSKENVRKIAELIIKKLQKKLYEQNITIKITHRAMDWLIAHGYDNEYGARPMRRIIEQTIEDSLAEAILSGSVKENTNIEVDINDSGKAIFKQIA